MGKAKFDITRKCKVCGRIFHIKTLESRYCSAQCSKIAYKQKRAEAERTAKLDELAEKIPEGKVLIKVSEAYALFDISRDTLYRLIRKGMITSINLGTNKTLLSKDELTKKFPLRSKPLKLKSEPILYSLEPKDCYTIGEIAKKYHMDDSTVYLHIRKYSIPTRQIGNYVYVPKKEIDNLYK